MLQSRTKVWYPCSLQSCCKTFQPHFTSTCTHAFLIFLWRQIFHWSESSMNFCCAPTKHVCNANNRNIVITIMKPFDICVFIHRNECHKENITIVCETNKNNLIGLYLSVHRTGTNATRKEYNNICICVK